MFAKNAGGYFLPIIKLQNLQNVDFVTANLKLIIKKETMKMKKAIETMKMIALEIVVLSAITFTIAMVFLMVLEFLKLI